MSLAREIIGRRIVDPKAETVQELMKATGMGRSYVQLVARENVAEGRWEKVWKKVGNNWAPAYRKK